MYARFHPNVSTPTKVVRWLLFLSAAKALLIRHIYYIKTIAHIHDFCYLFNPRMFVWHQSKWNLCTNIDNYTYATEGTVETNARERRKQNKKTELLWMPFIEDLDWLIFAHDPERMSEWARNQRKNKKTPMCTMYMQFSCLFNSNSNFLCSLLLLRAVFNQRVQSNYAMKAIVIWNHINYMIIELNYVELNWTELSRVEMSCVLHIHCLLFLIFFNSCCCCCCCWYSSFFSAEHSFFLCRANHLKRMEAQRRNLYY